MTKTGANGAIHHLEVTMPRIRLVDVARRADVSVMTVSNVINNHPQVRPAMRARVEAAINELGYRPHAPARQLATGRTNTIAIALPQLNVPYFAELSRELANQAHRMGYRVMIEQTIFGQEEEWAVLQQHEKGVVDGVLFHPVTLSGRRLAAFTPDFPLVLLGEAHAPASLDHVKIDNVRAARRAVEHLMDLGCERVAFLGTEQGRLTQATRDRRRGWTQAVRNRGREPDLEMHIGGYGAPDGERAVRAALENGISFDGLLCRDDVLATGAMRALHHAGRQVPQDVAVIGWDDIALAPFTIPSLTTIAPDKPELAATALELLKQRIAGYDGPGIHRIAGAELTIRESAPTRAPDT